MFRRKLTLGVMAAAAMGFGVTAQAGDGDITPIFDMGGQLEKIQMDTKVYVDLPRTAAQMADFQAQLAGAAQTMCDQTDGLISLENVTFVNHPSEKTLADIIWYARNTGRAVSGRPFGKLSAVDCAGLPTGAKTGPAGQSAGRFYVYGTSDNRGMHDSQLIGHEFGHLLLGLPDHYQDQRALDTNHMRSVAFSGRQSHIVQGNTFFRSPRNSISFTELPRSGPPQENLWVSQSGSGRSPRA